MSFRCHLRALNNCTVTLTLLYLLAYISPSPGFVIQEAPIATRYSHYNIDFDTFLYCSRTDTRWLTILSEMIQEYAWIQITIQVTLGLQYTSSVSRH